MTLGCSTPKFRTSNSLKPNTWVKMWGTHDFFTGCRGRLADPRSLLNSLSLSTAAQCSASMVGGPARPPQRAADLMVGCGARWLDRTTMDR